MRKSIVIGSDRDLRNWLFEADQGGAAPGAPAAGGAPAAPAAGGGVVDIKAGPDAVLKAVGDMIKDPEKKKMLLAGATDGDPADEVIKITPGSRAAKDLVPTQSEIGSSQSLDDQIGDKYGNLDNAIKGGKMNSAQGQFPILTFGNYILDGHHRWSQAYATNPNATLDTAEISAPGVSDAKSALGLTHTILLALYGKSPTKGFSGQNLFEMQPEEIKTYVLAKITDTALQKLATAKLISKPDKNEAAEMYARNLGELKKKKGEYPRAVMPQPLDAGDQKGLTEVPPDAEAGKINYNNPKPEDVKAEALNEARIYIRRGFEPSFDVTRWQRLAGIKR